MNHSCGGICNKMKSYLPIIFCHSQAVALKLRAQGHMSMASTATSNHNPPAKREVGLKAELARVRREHLAILDTVSRNKRAVEHRLDEELRVEVARGRVERRAWDGLYSSRVPGIGRRKQTRRGRTETGCRTVRETAYVSSEIVLCRHGYGGGRMGEERAISHSPDRCRPARRRCAR